MNFLSVRSLNARRVYRRSLQMRYVRVLNSVKECLLLGFLLPKQSLFVDGVAFGSNELIWLPWSYLKINYWLVMNLEWASLLLQEDSFVNTLSIDCLFAGK